MKSHQIEALQPLDAHNQKLQSNFTLIIIKTQNLPINIILLSSVQALPGWLLRLSGQARWESCFVERSLMGGDCLNVGCVPSKGIISSARAYAAAVRDAGNLESRFLMEPLSILQLRWNA
jgi:hypothetical protein